MLKRYLYFGIVLPGHVPLVTYMSSTAMSPLNPFPLLASNNMLYLTPGSVLILRDTLNHLLPWLPRIHKKAILHCKF